MKNNKNSVIQLTAKTFANSCTKRKIEQGLWISKPMIYLESHVLKVVVLFICFSLPTITTFAQCPMCKLSAGDSDVRAGLNNGILYLLAMPFLLMGGALFFWYMNRRKFENHSN